MVTIYAKRMLGVRGVPDWLILVYKIPPEPSRYRLGVWRKLKAEGAIYLQNGVAALPADARAERVMRGLVHDIRKADGAAHLIEGRAIGDETALESVYSAARDEEYREFIGRCQDLHAELDRERAAANLTFAELEENEEDLAKLDAWLAKIAMRDRLGAPLKDEAERSLIACQEDVQAFAASVYEVVDHGSADVNERHGKEDGVVER